MDDTKLKIPAYYFLIKAVLGMIGFILFVDKNFSMVSNFTYGGNLSFLFGDFALYRISILLPFLLSILSFIAFISLRKKYAFSGILAAIILVIDVFSFPVGTLVSLGVLAYILYYRDEFLPFPRKTVVYRIAGLSIIAFSIMAVLLSSGYTDNLMNEIQPQDIKPMQKIDLQSLAEREGEIEVVVSFDTPVASQSAVKVQKAFIQDIEMMGGSVTGSTVFAENTVTAVVDAENLYKLASNPDVKYIVPNEEVWFVPQNDDSNVTVQASVPIKDAYKYVNVEPLWRKGLTGEGVTVAVVDTGINSNLPAFERNGESIIIDSYRLYAEYVQWHGTAVASCIASQDEEIKGTAPGVSLLNVEVFQPNGAARISDILSGWEWVARWKAKNDRPVVCCNSLGAHPLSPGGRMLEEAANNMVLVHDIPMVVASGNMQMGGPFADFPLMVNVPGTAENVLTVGATDRNNNIASFSCYTNSNKPDVVAPGVNILMFNPQGRKIINSGTSFATPLTAGAVALVMQENKEYSAEQIQDSFKDGAKDIGMPGKDKDSGYGMVDAETSLMVLQGQKPHSIFSSENTILYTLPVFGFIILLIPEIIRKKRR